MRRRTSAPRSSWPPSGGSCDAADRRRCLRPRCSASVGAASSAHPVPRPTRRPPRSSARPRPHPDGGERSAAKEDRMTSDPTPTDAAAVTAHEAEQVARANASGRTPVVFVHGLWLLPSSWDRWAQAFEDAGYTALAPGWPDDPETVEQANANPEVFARKTVGQVADHFAAVIGTLHRR